MTFVVVQHPKDYGKFLFTVPDGCMLCAGDYVTCDTRVKKHELGICVTPTFEADPDVVCELWGTTRRQMKPITGILREFILERPKEIPFTDPNIGTIDDLPY